LGGSNFSQFGRFAMKKKLLIFFLVIILSSILGSAIKTIEVEETDLVSLKPKATDADADQLSYTFSPPLDAEGKWQTNYGDAGEYNITITVSDGQLSTSQDVLLVVKKKNVAPEITSFSPSGYVTINEGEEVSFSVEATDVNGDELTYDWSVDGKDVAQGKEYTYKAGYTAQGGHRIRVEVSDNETEATHEWEVNVNDVDRTKLLDSISDVNVKEGDVVRLNLPDFAAYNLNYSISDPIGNDNYWQTGYNDSGVYSIKIEVMDDGFSDSKTVKVEVANQDRAPVLKPIESVWMKENQRVSVKLDATDPDGNKIEYSAENMPEGATLTGDEFEWVPGYDTVTKDSAISRTMDKLHLLYKPFRINFIAKSGSMQDEQSFLIFVKDVNRAPVIQEIKPITVNEGEKVSIPVEASDPDGDKVKISYEGWIESANYTTTYDDAGVYKVKVTASDGFLSSETFATITVLDTNRPPVFGEIPRIEVREGERVEIPLFASDPDGDSVTISSDSLPENASIENNVFTWVPDYDTVTEGSARIPVEFKATDGKEDAFKEVNITVFNVNRAPEITGASPGPSFSVGLNNKVAFEINASDPDGDEISYVWKFSFLEQYKAGNAMLRKFSTTGRKKVTVIVSDGKEETEHVWNVNVIK
jgi:predicted DNA-binding antitoxin AbrB/MazE fold protein